MKVLYEDNHLIAVNKQISDLVQGDKTGDISLDTKLKEYLKEKYNKPGNVFVGVIHRIDRPVSGVVLFAKTSKALARMNKQLQEKNMTKVYYAIVKDMPPKQSDILEHYMIRNPKNNKSTCNSEEKPGSKLAKLKYEIIGKSDNYYLLKINLYTGRHHQIRSQLSTIGCPIKGDLKYGFPRSNPNKGISLHAIQIEFEHPTTKELIVIKAPFPEGDIWDKFEMNGI